LLREIIAQRDRVLDAVVGRDARPHQSNGEIGLGRAAKGTGPQGDVKTADGVSGIQARKPQLRDAFCVPAYIRRKNPSGSGRQAKTQFIRERQQESSAVCTLTHSAPGLPSRKYPPKADK
jgi:hypothetical protein